MFTLTVDSNLPVAVQKLATIAPEKWGAILANAANETGYYVVNKYKQQIPSFFDRPTPFTINSMYLQKATQGNLEASVQWKPARANGNSAGQYLQPEVFGGNRPQKKFERALQSAGLMPSGHVCIPTSESPKDSYGNVPSSVYQAILAYLQANPNTQKRQQVQRLARMGFTKLALGALKTGTNLDKKYKSEAKAKAKALVYFTAIKGQDTHLSSGIYWRDPGFGSDIRMIFAFVPQATYHPTFPFEQIGADAAASKFPEKLDAAIAMALGGTAPKP